MMTPEDFEKVSHILASYKGCRTKLWQYLLSHKQLHIQLIGDNEERYRDEGRCTDLVCYDCTLIKAQTAWKNAHIKLQELEPPKYAVVDTQNGLLVECKLIIIYEDVTKPVV